MSNPLTAKILKAREAMRAAKKNGRADVPAEDLEEVTELFDGESGSDVLDETLSIIRSEQKACREKACRAIEDLRDTDG